MQSPAVHGPAHSEGPSVYLGFTVTPNLFPFLKDLPFFKDLYKEIIIRSPEKGRFFRVQVGFRVGMLWVFKYLNWDDK